MPANNGLPLEILEIIGFYFGSDTSFKLIIGMQINKGQVFREGGWGVVLENILYNYPDRYALNNLKKHLPNKEIPLIKAVYTKNMDVLRLVSKIWNSTHSDFAYVNAVQTGFIDALDFIGHNIPPPDQQRLNMYIIHSKSKEAFDKVDLTIDDPLRYVLDGEYLSELNRDDLLSSDEQLMLVYEHRKDVDSLVKYLLKEENQEEYGYWMNRKANVINVFKMYADKGRFEEALSWLVRHQTSRFLNFSYLVFSIRDMRVVERLKGLLELTELDLEIHQMFIKKDIAKIEELYLIHPEEVLHKGKEYYMDVLRMCNNSNIGGYFRGEETSFSSNDINDYINKCCPMDHLEAIRKFVEIHGEESVNNITQTVCLNGKENIIWFSSICMRLGYKVEKEKHLLNAYLKDKTIYYPPLNLTVRKANHSNNTYYALATESYYSYMIDLAINYSTYFNDL